MEECVVSAVFKEELKVFYTQILNIKRSHVNVSYRVVNEHQRVHMLGRSVAVVTV